MRLSRIPYRWRTNHSENHIRGRLVLAMGAVMRPAAGDQNAADGGNAAAAGQAGALVNTVLDLEKSALACRVDVIGDRRAAQVYGVPEDLAKGETETLELGSGEPAGHASGSNAGTEEAFVSVDVADPGEQRLIEESGLDGEAAVAEERGERLASDGEGLEAGSLKSGAVPEVFICEAPETARINKAQLEAAGKSKAGVGVRRQWSGRIGNEQAAGHAQVDDPLGIGNWIFRCGCAPAGAMWKAQLADDVFAGTMDGEKDASSQSSGDFFGRGFERLRMGAEPDLEDAVAADPLVDTAGDGFHFRELGHRSIIARAQLSESASQRVSELAS
jgi:hypothetical protein